MYDYSTYKGLQGYLSWDELNIRWCKHGHRNCARQGSAPHRHSDSNSRLWVGPNRILVPQLAARWQSGSWRRTSRLNIGWDKLSRRIQNFVKAIKLQNQQRNGAFHLNAEPATNSLRAPTQLPSDVMQRAAEISKEPRAHKQSLKVFQATQRTTWDWKSFGKPLHERK